MSNYVTAIGLDARARSIRARALNPTTGEAERASSGYDPAAAAERAPALASPRAVCEGGATGFRPCRAPRALGPGCAAGAVPKMRRPAADRGGKAGRRGAEFPARPLAARNVVEAWAPDDRAEAARDPSRALADARDDPRRARQRTPKLPLRHGHAFDERAPAGRRRGGWTRACWRRADATGLGGPDDAAACGRCRDCVRRRREARDALAGRVAGKRPVVASCAAARETARRVRATAGVAAAQRPTGKEGARPRGPPRSRPLGGRSSPLFGQRGAATPASKAFGRGPRPQRRNARPERPRADIGMPNARRTDTPSSGGGPG